MISQNRFRRSSAGLTLLELLVSVGIIAILAMMLTIAVSKATTQRVKMTECASNIRQIGAVISSYAADNNLRLPRWNAGRAPVPIGTSPGTAGEGGDVNPAWAQMLVAGGYIENRSKIFRCPADRRDTEISYTMNVNVAGHSLSAITRPSKAALLTERYDGGTRSINSYGYAGVPHSLGIANKHDGYAVFLFVDGHTEILKYSAGPNDVTPPHEFWQLSE